MTKRKKILVQVKPEPFNLFFKEAPELKNTEITNLIGEVVKEIPTENGITIEFPGLGTRYLKRDDVIFI